MINLQTLIDQLLPVVATSNARILKAFHQDVKREWKNEGHFTGSIVTKTDKQIDHYLRQELAKILPQAGFITEESAEGQSAEYTWIIDPIDGTANFANAIPIFGTLIGLWKGDEPILGVISFPVFNEVIVSAKGLGVYLNGKKVKFKMEIQNKGIYASLGHIGTDDQRCKLLKSLEGIISSPANYYCTAFHMGMVVLQRMDVTLLMNLSLWDIAAGVAIAKEAGLGVAFLNGPVDLTKRGRDKKYQVALGHAVTVIKIVAKLSSKERQI